MFETILISALTIVPVSNISTITEDKSVISSVYIERGEASWYGEEYHGRQTASGEIYNMYDLTAAHKTLPFGTKVLVTNKHTGQSVIVRINDRGPFKYGRIIDVSKQAAKHLGIYTTGHAPVSVEILD